MNEASWCSSDLHAVLLNMICRAVFTAKEHVFSAVELGLLVQGETVSEVQVCTRPERRRMGGNNNLERDLLN